MFAVAKKHKNRFIGYIIMALGISLVCNFSYLLLLVSNQSSSYIKASGKRNKNAISVVADGKLSLHADGYGYVITNENDSIFIDHRKVVWWGLADGDLLQVEASERSSFEAKNLFVRYIIKRNGDDFDYGAIYRGSDQWNILLYQFLFYFALSLILLMIMNFSGSDISIRQFIIRSTLCLMITCGTYFVSPIPIMHTGEVIPVFQSRHIVELAAILKSSFMLAVVILYSQIYTLIYREQQITLENEMLRSENLTTKYNMLISQINPHFLFNSLSSLSMLVREKNEERTLEYIDQLSYTFRYLSQNGANSTFVTLREEIQFAEAYSYLFKIRYADKIAFEFEIEEKYLDYKLPPISLQPLIGNTVKHNTISSKHLFRVRIFTEDGYLVVANEKRPMLEPNPGTGVGLSNLNSRYQLLLGREIEIIDNDTDFVVRLPLEKIDE